jgi:hypothetical protein
MNLDYQKQKSLVTLFCDVHHHRPKIIVQNENNRFDCESLPEDLIPFHMDPEDLIPFHMDFI